MVWDQGWDKIFKDNEWGKYPPEEVVRFVARNFGKVPVRSAVKILEVGCGPGANVWYLAREGYSAYGVDGSPVAIEQALQCLNKEHLKAQVITGDAMHLPFDDNYFDGVLDVECVYANTLQDARVILGEIKRVLKPGGLFFSKTFMAGMQESSLRSGYGVIRFTAEEEIKDLYGGFDIISVDHLLRSEGNRRHEIKEWLIIGRKLA